eukprot:scaffold182217_cov33-Tisochrysis_lutea.AAC.1
MQSARNMPCGVGPTSICMPFLPTDERYGAFVWSGLAWSRIRSGRAQPSPKWSEPASVSESSQQALTYAAA